MHQGLVSAARFFGSALLLPCNSAQSASAALIFATGSAAAGAACLPRFGPLSAFIDAHMSSTDEPSALACIRIRAHRARRPRTL